MTTNHELFQRAQSLLPGGVNSPVRAFKSVGGEPFFTARAEGAYLWDVDGKRYIDYVGSWGPMILGHGHPEVREAVAARDRTTACRSARRARPRSTMAETITRLVPSIEMVRMVNSGTEATMSAIRLARGFTGRDKIVKFEGCYHGHVDSLPGQGRLRRADPRRADLARRAEGARRPHADPALQRPRRGAASCSPSIGDEIAGVIIEPVVGNMGCVPPRAGLPRKACASCARSTARC